MEVEFLEPGRGRRVVSRDFAAISLMGGFLVEFLRPSYVCRCSKALKVSELIDISFNFTIIQ